MNGLTPSWRLQRDQNVGWVPRTCTVGLRERRRCHIVKTSKPEVIIIGKERGIYRVLPISLCCEGRSSNIKSSRAPPHVTERNKQHTLDGRSVTLPTCGPLGPLDSAIGHVIDIRHVDAKYLGRRGRELNSNVPC